MPPNQYGYMALMDDYVFLEEVGRKVGEWGKEIVTGGYLASGTQSDGRGRGGGRGRMRGRGRGAHTRPDGPRSKREVLKMALDNIDIEMELLPVGMERRTLNQSTWDASDQTALLTMELVFHPPRFSTSSGPSTPPQPVRILTHRNRLSHSLLSNLQSRLSERVQSKTKQKEKSLPEWITDLVLPHSEDPEAFVEPVCVMQTRLDPLAAVSSIHQPYSSQYAFGLRPGHITRQAYYKIPPGAPLSTSLRRKNFVEFPTIEIFESGTFSGTIVDDEGSIIRSTGDAETDEEESGRRKKRRKLGKKEGREKLGGLLGGYGSGSGSEDDDKKEEQNVFNMLSGYAGSDDEAEPGAAFDQNKGSEGPFDFELGDEDAEGETDDGEFEDDYDEEDQNPVEPSKKDPEALAKILEQLRREGALRDPGADSRFGVDDDEEQVDWGDSGDDE